MKIRNAKGNGSVRQRENGTWEARCTIDGKRKSFYGEKQADVLKAMRAALKDSDDGIYFEPLNTSFGEWLDVWLQDYVFFSVKPLTHHTYKVKVDTHIKPALGNIKLQKLNPTQIQQLYNKMLADGLSPKTIKDTHGIIRKCLDQAMKLRYIGINPADACNIPKVVRKEINPLTEDEILFFLEGIGDDEPYKNLFIVALFTGMREGEICGLPWSAVDFKEGTITVKQQLCRDRKNGGHYIASTKNDKTRVLPAAPFIMDILREVKQQQALDHLHVGLSWENEFDLVFTNGSGHYIYPQSAYRHFKTQATKIGRPDARFHDMRHTYAVTTIQEGDDIKTVQKNLGHATSSFTLDVYGHVSEKMKRDSADRMQKYYNKLKA